MPANEQEVDSLLPLLAELHEHWPDIDADCIAGDGAYETDELSRLCQVSYGIHPIFRLRHAMASPDIRGIGHPHTTRLGPARQVLCRVHGTPMQLVTMERPSCRDLRPGHEPREKDFALRMSCTTDLRHKGKAGPCGDRRVIPCSLDWSRLTYYPHHDRKGRPELYAFRQAMLIRLSGIESLWGALKGSFAVGQASGARSRIRDDREHEALISLCFVQRTAATLYDQRERLGQLACQQTSSNGTGARVVSHAGGGAHQLAGRRRGRGPRRRALTRPPMAIRPPSALARRRRGRGSRRITTKPRWRAHYGQQAWARAARARRQARAGAVHRRRRAEHRPHPPELLAPAGEHGEAHPRGAAVAARARRRHLAGSRSSPAADRDARRARREDGPV